jgi:hypothetical protein
MPIALEEAVPVICLVPFPEHPTLTAYHERYLGIQISGRYLSTTFSLYHKLTSQDYALDYPAIRGSIPAVFDMLIQHIEEVTKRIEDSVPGAIDELAAVCKPATCDVEFRVTRSTIDQLKSLVVALEVGLEAVGKAGRHITR